MTHKKYITVAPFGHPFNPSEFWGRQEQISNKVKGMETSDLLTWLTTDDALGRLQDTDPTTFQHLIFAKSAELSKRGVAPRWQRLFEPCESSKANSNALNDTKVVIDLFWLVSEYPNHESGNGRWQSLWTNGFVIERAIGITNRQILNAAKVVDLKLTPFQQYGCLKLFRKADVRSRMEKGKKFRQKVFEKQMKSLRNSRNAETTEDIANKQATIAECWMLADESPTQAAILFRQMTGKDIVRQQIDRTIKRACGAEWLRKRLER